MSDELIFDSRKIPQQINYNDYTNGWQNGKNIKNVCDMFFNVLTAEHTSEISTMNSTTLMKNYLENFQEPDPEDKTGKG